MTPAMPHPIRATILAATLAIAACVPTPAGRPSATPEPATAAPTPELTPSGPTPVPSFVRPTPTARPTFMAYVVVPGDTLESIARKFGTTPQSIGFWNRSSYPSLDPDSPGYEPDRIRIGWTLRLIPETEADPEEPG